MKRITSIQLNNFRAFYNLYEPIVLTKGENLLLYGENGSGKSSFFKALKHFFQSSREPNFNFEINSYATGPIPIDGFITMKFCDIDVDTGIPNALTEQMLSFGNITSNNSVQFVQNADLIKGFLDYRILLGIYQGKDLNLFKIIVHDLLYEHIPVGEIESIGKRWERIHTTLLKKDRRHNIHWEALDEIPIFETTLRNFLDRLMRRLNFLLLKYFRNNLRVSYNLTEITFDHDYKVWDAVQELHLQLRLNGKQIVDPSTYLNEARLSALAICLYLASLKENPILFEYKILFLDDVFIGLDATNRMPLLRILNDEFSDYQIFITTYDKYWYELAQRFFKLNVPGKWAFDNLYATTQKINNINFDKPLVIQNDDDFSKAVYYLHHSTKPDYPAAANYFRKYAEEVLSTYLPKHEIRNDDFSQIENYKLSNLVNSGLKFLSKIGAKNDLLSQLKSVLPTILHPLSHFNLESPIYKGELIETQKCLNVLASYLKNLQNQYRPFIPENRMIKLRFITSPEETGYYEIVPKEMIYLVQSEDGNIKLSGGSCRCRSTCVVRDAIELGRINPAKDDQTFQYSSIENAYDQIFNYLTMQPIYAHILRSQNYSSEFLIHNTGNWVPLNSLIVW